MKNILIATDFSKQSDYAIHYVVQLVQRLQDSCHILLLNSYLVPKDTHQDKLIEVNDKLRNESLLRLKIDQKILSGVLKGKKITIETISQFGSLHNVLLNQIKNNHFNFIVIGGAEKKESDYSLDRFEKDQGLSFW